MRADLPEALRLVLQYEGGYSDDPTDTGGQTMYGITHDEYDHYRDEKGLPRQWVGNISMDEVTDIYSNKYWVPSGGDIWERRLAITVFDWHVNSGRGVTTLQYCLGIPADGVVGHQTINEVKYWTNKGKLDELLHNYYAFRNNCYRAWGRGSQACFLKGWLSRSNDLADHLNVE